VHLRAALSDVSLVVAIAVVAHFAFLCYLIIGGFVALCWRRTIWLHVPAVLWGIAITTARLDCPLIALERWSISGRVPGYQRISANDEP
jgi:hypothetical protein